MEPAMTQHGNDFAAEVCGVNFGWTVDIPMGCQIKLVEAGITPAKESARGRGCPLVDACNLNDRSGDFLRVISIKRLRDSHTTLTTGNADHIRGVCRFAQNNELIVLGNLDGGWIVADVAPLIEELLENWDGFSSLKHPSGFCSIGTKTQGAYSYWQIGVSFSKLLKAGRARMFDHPSAGVFDEACVHIDAMAKQHPRVMVGRQLLG
jgi:hypothetical protein